MDTSLGVWEQQPPTNRPDRIFYQQRLRIEFLSRNGNAFQELFREIMAMCYPTDFYAVCPWGRDGDRKNDGYLKSERMLFQVYAPYEMSAPEAVAKIDQDFNGALPHWKEHFNTWVFVHNATRGLPPQVLKKLLELEAAHAYITLTQWSYEAIRLRAMRLPEEALAELLGPSPSYSSMNALGLPEIIPILEAIQDGQQTVEVDIRPVPADKIAVNALSHEVQAMLKLGMIRSNLVEGYLRSKAPNPSYGDQLASAFKRKYQSIRQTGLGPDDTFTELQIHAGGGQVGSAVHQCAVLAVLAYFFEHCDIFERVAP